MINKRGFAALVVLMLGTLFFILGLALSNPLKEVVADALNSTELSCSTASTYKQKAACVSVDLMHPLFIGFVFGLAGAYLGRMGS